MRFRWQKHYLFPNGIKQAHHNGYSILWAVSPEWIFNLGGAQYEIMPGDDDDIIRFKSRQEMEQWLLGKQTKKGMKNGRRKRL